jgi:hypothetical protein
MIRCHSSSGSYQTRYLLEHYTGAPTSLPVAHSLTCHQRERVRAFLSVTQGQRHERIHTCVAHQNELRSRSHATRIRTVIGCRRRAVVASMDASTRTCTPPPTSAPSAILCELCPFSRFNCIRNRSSNNGVCDHFRVPPVTTSQPPAPAQPLQAPNKGTRLLPVPLAYPCLGRAQHRALAHVWPGVTRPSLGQRWQPDFVTYVRCLSNLRPSQAHLVNIAVSRVSRQR